MSRVESLSYTSNQCNTVYQLLSNFFKKLKINFKEIEEWSNGNEECWVVWRCNLNRVVRTVFIQ